MLTLYTSSKGIKDFMNTQRERAKPDKKIYNDIFVVRLYIDLQ